MGRFLGMFFLPAAGRRSLPPEAAALREGLPVTATARRAGSAAWPGTGGGRRADTAAPVPPPAVRPAGGARPAATCWSPGTSSARAGSAGTAGRSARAVPAGSPAAPAPPGTAPPPPPPPPSCRCCPRPARPDRVTRGARPGAGKRKETGKRRGKGREGTKEGRGRGKGRQGAPQFTAAGDRVSTPRLKGPPQPAAGKMRF